MPSLGDAAPRRLHREWFWDCGVGGVDERFRRGIDRVRRSGFVAVICGLETPIGFDIVD